MRSNINATTPLTSAAATEVPVVNWYCASGAGASTSTPGAATVM